jgi:hypothetical protein
MRNRLRVSVREAAMSKVWKRGAKLRHQVLRYRISIPVRLLKSVSFGKCSATANAFACGFANP